MPFEFGAVSSHGSGLVGKNLLEAVAAPVGHSSGLSGERGAREEAAARSGGISSGLSERMASREEAELGHDEASPRPTLGCSSTHALGTKATLLTSDWTCTRIPLA